MILFVLMRSKKDTYYFSVFSRTLTSAMLYSFKNANDRGLKCIWFRHAITEEDLQKEVEIPGYLIRKNFISKGEFLEYFLYYQCKLQDPSALFIIGSSDELFPIEIFDYVLSLDVKEVHKVTIGIDRIWVRKHGLSWDYSKLAGKGGRDLQFRVFSPSSSKADCRIHTPGFKLKKTISIARCPSIIHLDLQEQSVGFRRRKLLMYDSVQPGQFVAKLRFYLPECFDPEEVNWTPVSGEELSTLEFYEVNH